MRFRDVLLGFVLASGFAWADSILSAGKIMILQSDPSDDAFSVNNGIVRLRVTWDGQLIVNSLRSPGANGSMRVVCVDSNGQFYRSNRSDRCS